MFYLLLTILGSAMVSILIRFSEDRIENPIGMLEANYIACLLISAGLAGFDKLFPAVPELGSTLFMGSINGVLFLACYLLMQLNVRRNGVVLTSTFSKLGLLVSIVVSILFFGEKPTAFQIAGFILAIGAIFLINYRKDKTATDFKFGLILMLIFGGAGDAMAKVYEELGAAELEPQFLFYTFLVSFILCTAILLYKKERMGKREALFGVLIAIPNFVSTSFMLKALATVPAVIVFPAFSVGAILVVTMAGILCFRERLRVRQWIGVGAILVALVLLNI